MVAWFAAAALTLAQADGGQAQLADGGTADGGTLSIEQQLDDEASARAELETQVADLRQKQQALEQQTAELQEQQQATAEAAERANADLAALEQQRAAAEQARGQRLASAGGALASMRELTALLEAGSYEVSAPLSSAYAQLEVLARSAEQNGTAPEAAHARASQRALDGVAAALGQGDFQAAKIALAAAAYEAQAAGAAANAQRAANAPQPP